MHLPLCLLVWGALGALPLLAKTGFDSRDATYTIEVVGKATRSPIKDATVCLYTPWESWVGGRETHLAKSDSAGKASVSVNVFRQSRAIPRLKQNLLPTYCVSAKGYRHETKRIPSPTDNPIRVELVEDSSSAPLRKLQKGVVDYREPFRTSSSFNYHFKFEEGELKLASSASDADFSVNYEKCPGPNGCRAVFGWTGQHKRATRLTTDTARCGRLAKVSKGSWDRYFDPEGTSLTTSVDLKGPYQRDFQVLLKTRHGKYARLVLGSGEIHYVYQPDGSRNVGTALPIADGLPTDVCASSYCQ